MKNDFAKNEAYKYRGAIHVHSTFSDGSGDIFEIVSAAKKAGLSWIIVTDHNNLDIQEGIYRGIYVLKGEEISPPDDNHYLAFGIDDVIQPSENPEIYVQEVRTRGGFGFAAHPDESEKRKNKAKPIKWLDKTIKVDGVEIWNWFSDWANNYDETNIFTIAYAYFFRHNLIKGPSFETLKWWDELNNNAAEIVPAIGGVDAHALKTSEYIIPLKIFPYKCCFNTLNNIITLENPLPECFEEAKMTIFNAIKRGSNIIINQKLNNTKNFPEFYIANSNSKAFCGDAITLTDNTYLTITIPKFEKIKVFRDGKLFSQECTNLFRTKLKKPGKYRFEAYYKNHPWIYSNPICVK